MNTHSVRVVLCGFLAAIVLVAAQGCVSSPRRGADGRPPTIQPQVQRDGLTIPVTAPVIVQKRSPTPTPSAKKRALRTNVAMGTQTIDLEAVWPSGATGSVTLTTKCYPAFLDTYSGEYYVSNDGQPLAVFGGAASTTVTVSNSNPPDSLKASVNVNLDNESGNFFYLGTRGATTSGSTTYTFFGGTILTKP